MVSTVFSNYPHQTILLWLLKGYLVRGKQIVVYGQRDRLILPYVTFIYWVII
jgi:hypothetical protein